MTAHTTKTIRLNPHVEVNAHQGWWGFASVDDEIKALETIAKAIDRHVDDAEPARVMWERVTVCAYCDEPVEGSYDEDGTPLCCDRAQAEHVAAEGGAS